MGLTDHRAIERIQPIGVDQPVKEHFHMVALSAAEGDVDPLLREAELRQAADNCLDGIGGSVIHIKAEKLAGTRSSEDGDGILLAQVIEKHAIRQNARNISFAFRDENGAVRLAQYVLFSVRDIQFAHFSGQRVQRDLLQLAHTDSSCPVSSGSLFFIL